MIVYDNEIVAGVSSYTYYHSGIEIEIDTREDHRQKVWQNALVHK